MPGTDISMLYYHADQIIEEVRDSQIPFLDELIKKQKERLKG
jgi:hypothetical protein